MIHTVIDSHCHLDRLSLDDSDFSTVKEAVNHAQKQGVNEMLCVSITLDDWPNMMKVIDGLPGVYASVGHHPCDVRKDDLDLTLMLDYAQHPQVVAVGETGLDYFHTSSDQNDQRKAFALHIQAAESLKKTAYYSHKRSERRYDHTHEAS